MLRCMVFMGLELSLAPPPRRTWGMAASDLGKPESWWDGPCATELN